MPLYQIANFSTSGSAAGSWALWRIDEPENQLLAQLNKTSFSLEELERIKVPQRRLEWLGCRLALQRLLAPVCLLEEMQLLKNERGRPYLQLGDWQISLSHSFPFAGAALHPLRPVGLDMEQPRPQLLRIKHKFLSQQEQQWAGDDLNRLCQLWTAKEALYKLSGQPGLSFARDMLIMPQVNSDELQAFLFKQPYNLHFQWLNSLLLCVAV